MKVIFYDLFYENGQMSLTRILAAIGYLIFAIGSFYLMINNIRWDGYETFAIYTGGGGTALQFANKFINSKYNTASGSYETVDQERISKSIKQNPNIAANKDDPNIGTK